MADRRGCGPSRLTTHTFDLADGRARVRAARRRRAVAGHPAALPRADRAGPARSLSLDARPRRRRRGRSRGPAARRRRSAPAPSPAACCCRSSRAHADIAAVATATGVSARGVGRALRRGARHHRRRRGARGADVDAVVIATRHDTHADYAVARAARPASTSSSRSRWPSTRRSSADVEAAARGVRRRAAWSASTAASRRSPSQLREALGDRGPLVITYRVNAGRLPRSHWTHDPEVGGGRIVGEACHFVDFASFLAGAPPVAASRARPSAAAPSRATTTSWRTLTLRGRLGRARSSTPRSATPRCRRSASRSLGEAGRRRARRLPRAASPPRRATETARGHAATRATPPRSPPSSRRAATGGQPWPVATWLAVMRATFAHPRRACAPSAEPADACGSSSSRSTSRRSPARPRTGSGVRGRPGRARSPTSTVVCEQPNHPAGVFHPGFGRRPLMHRSAARHRVVHRLWVARRRARRPRAASPSTARSPRGAGALRRRAGPPPRRRLRHLAAAARARSRAAAAARARRTPVRARRARPLARRRRGARRAVATRRSCALLERAERWLYRQRSRRHRARRGPSAATSTTSPAGRSASTCPTARSTSCSRCPSGRRRRTARSPSATPATSASPRGCGDRARRAPSGCAARTCASCSSATGRWPRRCARARTREGSTTSSSRPACR